VTAKESFAMLKNARGSTQVLKDILEIPGIDAAVIVGRDGFVIESMGNSKEVEVDTLGACLATAINSLEEMGKEMSVNCYQDMFVEYGGAVIMSRPVGDAIMSLVSPDASTLGIIRHKVKGYVRELEQLF
jgi:predicted regulator of Ras-like GTPase activity (Roadblock/LC7/MglB family)